MPVIYEINRRGDAVKFGDTNDIANVSLSPASAQSLKIRPTDEMTLCVLLYAASRSGFRTIISTRTDAEPDGYQLAFGAGAINFIFSNGIWGAENITRMYINTGVLDSLGAGLYYLAITKSISVAASGSDIYCNGALMPKVIVHDSLTTTTTVYDNILTFGRESIAVDTPTGLHYIHDIKIFNAKLPQSELVFIKNSQHNAVPGFRRIQTKTGTITAGTGTTSVTGSGTKFTTELIVGNALYNSANSLIGFISSITNDTSLTLRANSLITVSGDTYSAGNLVGDWGFKGKSGTLVTDRSPFANHATLTNMVTTLGATNQRVNKRLEPYLV